MKIPKAQAVDFERKIDEDIEKREVESLDFIQNVCHATSMQTRAVHALFKAVFIERGKSSMKASATDSHRASIRSASRQTAKTIQPKPGTEPAAQEPKKTDSSEKPKDIEPQMSEAEKQKRLSEFREELEKKKELLESAKSGQADRK